MRAALRRIEAEFAALRGIADGDILALAFLVMQQAAKSAQEDLKAIMARVKAINAAKAALRALLGKVQRDAARNAGEPPGAALDFSRGMGSERAYHRLRMPRPDPKTRGGVAYATVDIHPGVIDGARDFDAIIDRLKDAIDSMSEMGEMESLRLQMAMDRLSKLMTMLSNLLKKISDTAAAITQNLK
jgi:hypothetical protein